MNERVEEACEAILEQKNRGSEMDVSQVIQYLGSHAYSKMECIIAVTKLFALRLPEAKEIVHSSPTFAYRKEADEATQAIFIEGIQKVAKLHEPLSVQLLLEIWEGEPVPEFSGRVSLIGEASELKPNEIVNDQFLVLEIPTALVSAPVFIVILPDGGMISILRPDGSFVHELSDLEDFDCAAARLNLSASEIRRMQVAAYAKAMAGTDQDLDSAWVEAGLESLRKMYDEEEKV
ncbi:hypothetical protein [Deinococcus marmoris]|uniref:Uncharacterized protein n=1 Tax=Deinococcus marmoris TaxID=249408 RepID=A0A1U7P463_9DEIO|nr:hypothetical protein [Deinococcus marmoris]OLV19938.1 hypothetical protein BOO71_0001510 [Deinococcus marmoris]